jgi:hypothetical protein
MTKFLFFFLASTATLATNNPAWAQLPPTLGGTYSAPGYVAPSYPTPAAPGPPVPGYVSPGLTAPGYTAPGSTWRDQRANEDWRNNTWREQRTNEDWRTNNWRQQRANEDWRQREEYTKERTPNNAIDQGSIATEAAPKTTTETKPNALPKVETKTNASPRVEDCPVGVSRLSPACQQNAKDKAKAIVIDTTKKDNAINRGYGPK